MLRISIIAALAENRVIGNRGRIPWHIKADLVRFRDKTLGHATIMGRKTFESLLTYYQKSGKSLPKRTHVIVTHDTTYKPPVVGVLVAHSLDAAISEAQKIEKEEVFIAGGAQIYAQAITLADRLYLTIVHQKIEGDAYFPDYSAFSQVLHKEDHEENGIKFTFIDLEPLQGKQCSISN